MRDLKLSAENLEKWNKLDPRAKYAFMVWNKWPIGEMANWLYADEISELESDDEEVRACAYARLKCKYHQERFESREDMICELNGQIEKANNSKGYQLREGAFPVYYDTLEDMVLNVEDDFLEFWRNSI